MIFYVHLHNHVDRRDDDVIKIKAKDKKEAKSIAQNWNSHRFSVGRIYTAGEFKKVDRGWYELISSHKPINHNGEFTL